ncbi:hypothetical protein TCAL_02112 [Tigriopus californicus]|uniref:Nuclear inhibitor of protein phosphatase 1 n=1 Tax=Tigriopus californicus TaxID=6832 RepID=A0A553N9S2_TIGCA|nr:nuclear inhibitor of protein phosphatase 1-like [Tigriopus californicus]TRY62196.1 hypothetical protein TCAL_02112 [Tigriopus californicus]|eukprot:TCALIF_02112-PA protein Name:"Similar to Ppp1r8 Nuclear inhibitor of protein phosphatase 1 (Mus musculus)" AED:0.05 eAED:0.05 QI:207/1/1/1/1/1/4/46/348
MTNNLTTNYDIPNWAGKPPTGLHLDVLKDGKLIQKLMIDDKRCYLFGRNAQLNDVCIDHQSCSRVHAALVYHKHLHRMFLVDLGSTHGTFIGRVRLEGHKPTQLPAESQFHFGASTRMYLVRERPQSGPRPIMDELEKAGENTDGAHLLGLPETETELDHLTEFNTAHNRRITMLGIPEEKPRKKRKIRITFNEEEDVINPEDIDPSVGRFRNMIESTVIPKKRSNESSYPGLLSSGHSGPSPNKKPHLLPQPTSPKGLYDGIDPSFGGVTGFSSKLGIPLPNPAPDIDMTTPAVNAAVPVAPVASSSITHDSHVPAAASSEDPNEPKKKKYAKEAWPGKKPVPSLLM